MSGLSRNLIILGAGATAAVAAEGHTFPTANDFFDACNTDWTSGKSLYPHLSSAYNMVRALKADNKVTLTDVWLFLDTLNKYHSAIRGDEYNYRLLRMRYEQHRKDITDFPHYLTPGFLNKHYQLLTREMCPLFSTASKSMYYMYPPHDPVNYFLILAGWELKLLLFRTYSAAKPTNGLYAKLLAGLRDKRLHFTVLNFNYDVYFEKACHTENQEIKIWDNLGQVPKGSIALCKPHGGWNVQHVTLPQKDGDSAQPLAEAHETIRDSDFDRTGEREERPAMIPYFSGPDEIKEEHERLAPKVGRYFMDQQNVMKKMLREAKNIVSIGYSFSRGDLHVRTAIEELANQNRHQSRRVFCVLKGEDKDPEYAETKKSIFGLWERSGCGPEFYDEEFKTESIGRIGQFLADCR